MTACTAFPFMLDCWFSVTLCAASCAQRISNKNHSWSHQVDIIMGNCTPLVNTIDRVPNYWSPSRHWRLTFRFGDHQLGTKKKKRKKRKKERKKKEKLEQSPELCSRCFPHVRAQDREQRDKTTPCHNTQVTTRKQIYVSYVASSRKKADACDPERTFFLFVSVRSSARHGL